MCACTRVSAASRTSSTTSIRSFSATVTASRLQLPRRPGRISSYFYQFIINWPRCIPTTDVEYKFWQNHRSSCLLGLVVTLLVLGILAINAKLQLGHASVNPPDLCSWSGGDFNFAGSHAWKAEVPPLQSSKSGVFMLAWPSCIPSSHCEKYELSWKSAQCGPYQCHLSMLCLFSSSLSQVVSHVSVLHLNYNCYKVNRALALCNVIE